MPDLNVNILLHGLFFMTQEGNNLRVYAPNIPGHHFIGGIRGARTELNVSPDLTLFGLRGKADPQTGLPAPDPANDVDGSIMQFPTSDIGGFNGLNDKNPQTGQPLFKGSILLPWPIRFIGLRAGDISTTFRTEPGSIANDVVGNANRKGSSTLGVVTLLRYTLPSLNPIGGIIPNIHFYLQPCIPHRVADVNADLEAVQAAFKNPTGFDLKMLTDKEPAPVPTSQHSDLGTTKEDEQSFDEERKSESPDAVFICRNDPPPFAASPANCPIFFVGS